MPRLVWLSGLSTGLWTKGSLVGFPVRAHVWVMGQVLNRGNTRGNHTLLLLSLSSSLPSPVAEMWESSFLLLLQQRRAQRKHVTRGPASGFHLGWWSAQHHRLSFILFSCLNCGEIYITYDLPFYPYYVHNSVALSTFTLLCNHPTPQLCHRHRADTLSPLSTMNTPSPLPRLWLSLLYFLSLNLTPPGTLYEIIPYLSFVSGLFQVTCCQYSYVFWHLRITFFLKEGNILL